MDAKRRRGRWSEVAQELHEIKQQMEELSKQGTRLTKELKWLSDYETSRDGHFLYQKTTRKGSIDHDLLIRYEHVDLEQYRKPESDVWKLIKL